MSSLKRQNQPAVLPAETPEVPQNGGLLNSIREWAIHNRTMSALVFAVSMALAVPDISEAKPAQRREPEMQIIIKNNLKDLQELIKKMADEEGITITRLGNYEAKNQVSSATGKAKEMGSAMYYAMKNLAKLEPRSVGKAKTVCKIGSDGNYIAIAAWIIPKNSDDYTQTDEPGILPLLQNNKFIAEKNVQPGLIELMNKVDGIRWIGKLKGNGGRDAVIYIPTGFDPNQPAEIIYHFHGTHSHIVEKNLVGANRLGQVLSVAKNLNKEPNRNIILVYPLSAGKRGKKGGYADKNKYDDYWMKRNNSTNDDMKQMHAEILKKIKNQFGIIVNVGSITAKGHSAGGRALQNIAESGFIVNRFDFLDANYGDWAERCYKKAIKSNPDLQMNLFVVRDNDNHGRAEKLSNSRGVRVIPVNQNPRGDMHEKMNETFFGYQRSKEK